MSARLAPEQAELNIDGAQLVVLDYDENDQFVISYACQFLMENNVVTPIEVSFYYDLLFDTGEDPRTERQYLEFLLLGQIAQEYGLQSGNACISPPEDGTFYLVQATSLPEDVPNPQFDECFDLIPAAGQECISYSGTVSGYVLGPDDPSTMVQFIASSLTNGVVTAGTSLQVAFLGTQIDPTNGGRDSLTAAINQDEPLADESASNDAFTYVGILLTVALACAFVGLVAVVWRMRQRRQQRWREELIMTTDANTTLDSGGGGAYDTTGIITLPQSDHEQRDTYDESELPSQYGMENMVIRPNHPGDLPPAQGSYTFDLGDNMKLGVLGKHGGSSSRAKRALVEESEDSDVDSWAQTDATLGSLEVRIGEIRAEI
mmetsp:Transcript_21458/g.35534  ORF Transcript_21458/g.35534 Transcript_21458/m.35534 type:complete len:375 (+) Transcript_21458:232-1356(+)|eukprot:CAMPEP_0119021906 /NCGR_PEP_ID=MMETSP1176-20130426/26953_1 /TAXON_ID=265551 /ORGANISM="Synedropsis recta cf, Strain CCMP1620" /LENGTH=374 /DNA_ID=CAMNT_0006976615 /DNA_START=124 /DNA_END=1248 /DNA_ORIENTATION=+